MSATCSAEFFEETQFRRGFVERVLVQDWAVILYAEAIANLEVIRELEIENDAVAEDLWDLGDQALQRLIPILQRCSLVELDSHSGITSLKTVRLLASCPGLRSLKTLKLWFDCGDNGDEIVQLLAASPHLSGLASLEQEHSQTFTDISALAVLDSPHLAELTRCRLCPGESKIKLSAPVLKRFRKRFGTDPDD
jgi:hypothetical protein